MPYLVWGGMFPNAAISKVDPSHEDVLPGTLEVAGPYDTIEEASKVALARLTRDVSHRMFVMPLDGDLPDWAKP